MQDNTKSVAVKMTARRCFRTEPIYQYDVGHVLTFDGFELPAAFEVHFARSPLGKAITQIGTDGTCTLPDMFAQTAGVIYAWLYIADADSGLTKYSVEIPVAKRAQITDQEPTPVEQSAIDQAIAALNAGVEAAEDAQEAAEAAQASAESYAESAGQSAITATNAANSATSAKTAAETAARNAAASATDAHTSREAADQSATNAGVSERNAAASASAAAGSATSAATSAGQASASATAASGSASTASTKASEAAQSATAAAGSAASASEAAGTASTAATAAGESATAAAGSATAAAGSATSAGQSATAAAGSAQTAQDVLDSIPADYSELSEDVNSLKSAIINKADVIISSASGAIASFSDGADGLPVKSLAVKIEPVQDLHGYDSPWPAGGGKNLLNVGGRVSQTSAGVTYSSTDDYLIMNGTKNGATYAGLNNLTCDLPAGTYYAMAFVISGTISLPVNLVVNDYTSDITQTIIGTERTFTLEEAKTIRFRTVIWTDNTVITNYTLGIVISKDSGIDKWYPYSNICPISGWTAAQVTRTGRNLLESQIDSATIGTSGNIANSNSYYCQYGYVKAGVTYYTNSALRAFYTTVPAKGILSSYDSKRYNTNGSFVAPIDGYVCLRFANATETPMLSLEESEYEPYSGQTYSITLPSEAGTVYGCELTVNEDGTGQVVVDRVRVDLSTKSWTWSGAYASHWTTFTDIVRPANNNAVSNILGEQYRPTTYLDITDIDGNLWAISGRPSDNRVYVRTDGTQQTTPTGYVIYPVNTGVTYTLTASQVTTLLGTNNVWADAGNVAVSYRADTKLYIDGKITEAIANALNA